MEFTEHDFYMHYGSVINSTIEEEFEDLLNKTTDEQLVCRFFSKKYEAQDGIHCNASYDSVLCWPATLGGTEALLLCPVMINGVPYDTSKNASRLCYPNGTWDGYSNYTLCRPLIEPQTEEPFSDTDATILIYFIGFSLSVFAVITALFIFVCFKDLRCLRNTFHANLMATYLLRDLTWIIMASLKVDPDHSHAAHCALMVILYYFQGTNLFWMFVEGFYLYMLVVRTFTADKIKFNVYVFMGWGLPILVVVAWATVKAEVGYHREASETSSTGCPWLEKDVYDWIFNTPILLVLLVNLSFLVNIMWVLITKLRAATTDESQQYRKASKALLVLIPLLGVTYVLVIVSPNKGAMAFISAVLLSTQGFTVSVLYCFLNGEVRNTLVHHYENWRTLGELQEKRNPGQRRRFRNGSLRSRTESIRLCSMTHHDCHCETQGPNCKVCLQTQDDSNGNGTQRQSKNTQHTTTITLVHNKQHPSMIKKTLI